MNISFLNQPLEQVTSFFTKHKQISQWPVTRQQKLLILFSSSIFAGFLAAFLAIQLVGWSKSRVKVYVARQDVSSWTALKEPAKWFEEVERKESEVPGDHICGWEEFKDTILIRDLQAGEVVCKAALMINSKAGLEGRLKEGTRAVAIETDAVTVAGGFVHPDTYVDVIHTGLDDRQNLVTTVVLQDIRVLAQDQSMQPAGDKPGSVPATVTLEVDPSQALELTKAKEAGGKITLLLRPFGDHVIRPQKQLYVKNKDRETTAIQTGDEVMIRGRGSKPRLDTSVYDPEDKAPDPAFVAGVKSPPPPGK
jgi:Flp pilus assembly protein CpaB